MRRPHRIKPNHSNQSPHSCIWFDTETKPVKLGPDKIGHKLWFGWACFSRHEERDGWSAGDWYRFTSKTKFWSWVDSHTRPKTKLYMFCHNTSFDVPVLDAFNELPKLGWELSRAVIDAPPTMLTWRKDQATIVLWDTLNIWRMPLATLGKSIGRLKLSMPPPDAPCKQWDTYAKQDVDVIRSACLSWWQFLKDNDLGGVAPTLAGQAMRAFRHRFMKHELFCDDNDEALAVSRNCYMGGRVEAYRIGKLVFSTSLYDVNSMYPFVMKGENYPTRLVSFRRHCNLAELRHWLGQYLVCARVTVTTDAPLYALRRDGKLIFPIGAFECYLTTPDLKEAIKRGDVVRIHDAALYDSAPIFREFVEHFHGRRILYQEKNDTLNAWQFKILMNSLYGKFGQRGIVWEEAGRTEDLRAMKWEEIDVDTGQRRKCRMLGGLLQEQSGEQESRDSFPAIAAHVTAYARRYLYQLMQRAGPGNVFYCDTDSLLVNTEGALALAKLCHPHMLGALKCEGTYDEVEIWGAKDYRFGDKERHKGVRQAGTWIGNGVVRQDKWSSLRGLLNHGTLDMPTTETITKRLSRVYDKGRVLPSGGVVPWELGFETCEG